MSRMRSEDAIGAKGRPFTGAEYIESLRDVDHKAIRNQRLSRADRES